MIFFFNQIFGKITVASTRSHMKMPAAVKSTTDASVVAAIQVQRNVLKHTRPPQHGMAATTVGTKNQINFVYQ